MRVLHITPTHFGDASIVGGAERYAWELARAMARDAEVTFLALADAGTEFERDGVHVVHAAGRQVLSHPLARNPLSRRLFRAIRRTDVVHCHQAQTFVTSAAVVAARMIGRPVFVTDLGGGHPYSPAHYLPILRLASGFLLVSEYSRRLWAERPRRARPDRMEVIYGGVDTGLFRPLDHRTIGLSDHRAIGLSDHRAIDPSGPRSEVLYVGRLLPHKGIEHLIAAIEPPFALRIVGRPYDLPYLAMLKDRARGQAITFEPDVDDRGLVERCRSALALVLPSVSTDWLGRTTDVSELFGLVVVEAMACGIPVIVSRTGSLPELVEDGVTGFIVPPADPAEIRRRLRELYADPTRSAEMGRRAHDVVLQRFTWAATARRCLDAYLGRAAARPSSSDTGVGA